MIFFLPVFCLQAIMGQVMNTLAEKAMVNTTWGWRGFTVGVRPRRL